MLHQKYFAKFVARRGGPDILAHCIDMGGMVGHVAGQPNGIFSIVRSHLAYP